MTSFSTLSAPVTCDLVPISKGDMSIFELPRLCVTPYLSLMSQSRAKWDKSPEGSGSWNRQGSWGQSVQLVLICESKADLTQGVTWEVLK